ncbi:MAG: SCO family protein [Acidobacteriota bacterium]
MIIVATVGLLLATAPSRAEDAGAVWPEFKAGRSLPVIEVIDDNGRVRSTAEWKGVPMILAPIYSRCPLACPLIARGLKKGVAKSSAPPSSYRVVLFSFDPHDTPADLRRFRDRERLPLGWTVAKAVRNDDTRRLLDAAGYRYAEAGGTFIHENAVIALTADLRTAAMLRGTSYDIDDALAAAQGRRGWVGRFGGWLLAPLLFISMLAAVYLLTLLGARAPTTNAR